MNYIILAIVALLLYIMLIFAIEEIRKLKKDVIVYISKKDFNNLNDQLNEKDMNCEVSITENKTKRKIKIIIENENITK